MRLVDTIPAAIVIFMFSFPVIIAFYKLSGLYLKVNRVGFIIFIVGWLIILSSFIMCAFENNSYTKHPFGDALQRFAEYGLWESYSGRNYASWQLTLLFGLVVSFFGGVTAWWYDNTFGKIVSWVKGGR
ncbi:hypothetical protein L4Z20_001811 [Pseudomonas aeruginosa]|nr:hypothetical protein [Pseudomonas aeruginosa]MDG4145934.1 hypothetical protein [Pseudomonas aeruginosa]HBN9458363.1 hypothetical protein [Pseudomonas aeruginosa]HBO0300168.1 hypothetical protein [Pseudomonas aeruginosa]HCF1831844.1 hypothetical protein [Pseudomonas aeruginosa]